MRMWGGLAVATAVLALALSGAGRAAQPVAERVSISSTEAQGGLDSYQAALNGDGRYVAFSSDATNFVAKDTNSRDVFLRDRLAGTTRLVSEIGGVQASAPAFWPGVSGEGLVIVFESEANNLVFEGAAVESDIFVRDLVVDSIALASVSSDGTPGNGDSATPSISGNGRFVTFTSLADNLVPDDGNMDRDVFLRDRLTFSTELISMATDGTHGNFASGGLGAGPARVSGDGRFVAFGSFADNLVPEDGNSSDDAFLRDRMTGVTERISVSSSESEGSGHSYYPSVSDDGRFVAFYSDAEDLVAEDGNGVSDVFLRDRELGTTIRLSAGVGGEEADGASRFPVISADGRYVAFQSAASNLVANDTGTTDIFLLDRESGGIEKLTDGDGASTRPAISALIAVVAFQSDATDLVADDSNMRSDVFVWGKSLLPQVAMGDVDCNGTVNSIDSALVLQYGAGLLEHLACLPFADTNEDGAVNSIDAALILQLVAGLLDELPP